LLFMQDKFIYASVPLSFSLFAALLTIVNVGKFTEKYELPILNELKEFKESRT